MATNADEPAVDDSKPVTEDDLRALKYPNGDVDPPPAEDEPPEGDDPVADPVDPPEDDDQIVPPAPDEELPEATPPEAPAAFVKKFDNIKGDTPEEYAANLEAAYENSTTEAIRLKTEFEKLEQAPPVTPSAQPAPADPDAPAQPVTVVSPTDLYVQQQLDKEIQTAFAQTQKDYPQVSDPTVYPQFTQKVAMFSRTILETENRLASPEELYEMAAVSLKLQKADVKPDVAEELAMAAKNGAAAPGAPAAPSKPKPAGTKISEAQLKLNRQMYPGKSDADIVKELTPYL